MTKSVAQVTHTEAIEEMTKVLAAAGDACEGDVGRMVAAMVGALATTASRLSPFAGDAILRIASESLDHARRELVRAPGAGALRVPTGEPS